MLELGQEVLVDGKKGIGISILKKVQLGSLGKAGVAATNQFHLVF